MKYKHFVLYIFVTVSLIINFSNLELFGITNTQVITLHMIYGMKPGLHN